MSNKVSEATSLKDHGGVGVHHKTIQRKYSNVHHWDLLCNQTTMTGNVTEKNTWMASMSITISKVFVHLDTTQYRYSNDNYQTSQRKPQDISHQIHQDCNSKRSWLCGGHHLTRQCMYGNGTQSNLFAKKKNWKSPIMWTATSGT